MSRGAVRARDAQRARPQLAGQASVKATAQTSDAPAARPVSPVVDGQVRAPVAEVRLGQIRPTGEDDVALSESTGLSGGQDEFGGEDFDLSQFQKIDRPSSGEGSRLARPNPAEGDARTAAAIGSKFFGPMGSRGFGPVDSDALESATHIDALEEFRDRQAQVKQKAVEGFMEEMQAQYGVSPRAIVQAFGQMDAQALAGPPEDARESFLDNLNLKGTARREVGGMYDEMARVTGEAMQREKFATRQLDANIEILSRGENSIRRLNESLDKLNDTFFLRGLPQSGPFGKPMSAPDSQTDANDLDSVLMQQNRTVQGSERKDRASGLATLGAATGAASRSAATSAVATQASVVNPLGTAYANSAQAIEADGLDEDGFDSAIPDKQGSINSAFDVRAAFDPSLAAPRTEVKAQASTARNAYASTAGRAKIQEATTGGRRSIADSSVAGQPADAAVGATSEASTALAAGAQTAPRAAATGAAGGAAAMLAPGAKASPEDGDANIRELVRQANVIAKKGGGEMKLELRPEGMGQVNLKVSVQDGQVNVQMVTESNEAKRMLENGLHELKSGLSAHKLQLETLKIDSHDGIQKQMEQQQRDSQREAARQFASDFMGGFREERESFRQGFSENLPVRSYKGAPKPSLEEPSSSSARAQAARRLNLVA